jgi:hypothetical protein
MGKTLEEIQADLRYDIPRLETKNNENNLLIYPNVRSEAGKNYNSTLSGL